MLQTFSNPINDTAILQITSHLTKCPCCWKIPSALSIRSPYVRHQCPDTGSAHLEERWTVRTVHHWLQSAIFMIPWARTRFHALLYLECWCRSWSKPCKSASFCGSWFTFALHFDQIFFNDALQISSLSFFRAFQVKRSSSDVAVTRTPLLQSGRQCTQPSTPNQSAKQDLVT